MAPPTQRDEVEQPLLAEQADVDVDPVERAERADRVGAVLEHPGRPVPFGGPRRTVPAGCPRHVVVELLVVEPAAGELLLAPLGGDLHARGQTVDRVHRARVVDLVGGDQRGVQRAGPRGVEQLIDEVALRWDST